MNDQTLQIILPACGLLSGLLGAYIGLENRALLAEVRKELAELENRIIQRINGSYARTSECKLREENMHARLDVLAAELRNRSAAKD